LVLAQA